MTTGLIDDIQRRTFRGLLANTHPVSGLTADRWPAPSASSIAATGFALTAWPIGVEHGWISRAEAAAVTRRTLATLWAAPHGPQPRAVAGHRGFFYHFLNMATGLRAGDCELSPIDTALLMAGVLLAGRYFDGPDAVEGEIRRLSGEVFDAVDWPWAQHRSGRFHLGWSPEAGFFDHHWRGYNEAMLLYLLALGSQTHPASAKAWRAWTGDYWRSWRLWPSLHLSFGPMFGHQYSHVWIDFRGIQDAPMRRRGLDYFENSRRAVKAQQAYAIRNPGGWAGYGEQGWGLTACDGPGPRVAQIAGRRRRFAGYQARGPGLFDDGTLAPTAVAASLPFAPDLVEATLAAMIQSGGDRLYGPEGFRDAFNPTLGWVADDQIGIDQGPIVAMIENHRTALIWRLMRDEPVVRRGLVRAGFSGGWLQAEIADFSSRS